MLLKLYWVQPLSHSPSCLPMPLPALRKGLCFHPMSQRITLRSEIPQIPHLQPQGLTQESPPVLLLSKLPRLSSSTCMTSPTPMLPASINNSAGRYLPNVRLQPGAALLLGIGPARFLQAGLPAQAVPELGSRLHFCSAVLVT